MNTFVQPLAYQVAKIPDIKSLASANRHCFSLVIATMGDGSSIYLPINIMVGKEPGPCLLMVAGVHGDEYEGIIAQYELWEELDPELLKGEIIMVPVANPPAFRFGQRRNPEDMLDMNRIFPGNDNGSITERLAFHLYHDVAVKADMVLSMHGWIRGGLVVPYVEYPKQSKTTETCIKAARAFGLEYIEAFDWHEGLLAAACTRADIPAIESEIGGQSITHPDRRNLYKRCAKNLMRHLGILPGKPDTSHTVKKVTRQMLFAPCGGILRQHGKLGDQVKSGDLIASIYSLNGSRIVSCQAPCDGFIAEQCMTGFTNPGDLISIIFTPQAD